MFSQKICYDLNLEKLIKRNFVNIINFFQKYSAKLINLFMFLSYYFLS